MQRGGAQSTLTSRTDASGQLLFTLAGPAAVNGTGVVDQLEPKGKRRDGTNTPAVAE